MSSFFKSKMKLGIALAALLLVITVLAGALASMRKDVLPASPNDTANLSAQQNIPAEDTQASNAVAAFLPIDEETLSEEQPSSGSPPASALPTEMRGAFLVPGTDILVQKDASKSSVQTEIDQFFANAKQLGIHSVIVDTTYQDQVIYQTAQAPTFSSDFDVLAYVIEKAQAEDLATYAIFNTAIYPAHTPTSSLIAIGAGSTSSLTQNLREFSGKYPLDGILLDGYTVPSNDAGYAQYLTAGGGIGFDHFSRVSPTAAVKNAVHTLRESAPDMPIGLLSDGVWQMPADKNSPSTAQPVSTALESVNMDARELVENGYVDFLAVKVYGSTSQQKEPFQQVVNWWADVAEEQDLPLYIVHATDKLLSNETGWGSTDQIILQLDAVSNTSGANGSIFNNLTKLTANPSTVKQVQELYDGGASAKQILTKLEMTKPTQTTYTTANSQVTFTGACDPKKPVTINEKSIQVDDSGYFTVQYDLKSGLNTFVIAHKEQTITYKITRKIEVLKDVGPKGSLAVDGGTSITISALADEDADVYAMIGGTKVVLSVDTSVENETTRDGFFRPFSGNYLVPPSTAQEKNLGKIVVYAEYEGEKASMEAASVKINQQTPEPSSPPPAAPKTPSQDPALPSSVKPSDGVAVRITADQAITYPANTLNNIPYDSNYPLPAGAMDYAVGDEITFTKENKVYTYTKLASGLRVATKDLTAIEKGPDKNVIHSLSSSSDANYTYIKLQMDQKVAYSVDYSANSIAFSFHYTQSVPGTNQLEKNPLFTSASWSGQTLRLSFGKTNAFMGYKGYFEGNTLVLRFRNPPSSLANARIAIDPGHGGADRGADGFLAEYPESVINTQIAGYVAQELQSRGATVNLMNNAGIEGETRKQAAENWNADFFISIHANSAPNIQATGTEVYYFHPFSQLLAKNTASAVSSSYATQNRGAKYSYYHVTLSSQMPSILVETGFLTNRTEYEKLLQESNQKKIAVAIADALAATIQGSATVTTTTNSSLEAQSTSASGSTTTTPTPTPTSVDTSNTGALLRDSTEVSMQTSLSTLVVGEKKRLYVANQLNQTVQGSELTWQSDRPDIVDVDSVGVLTAKAAGNAKITASCKLGVITWNISAAPAISQLQIHYDGQADISRFTVSSAAEGKLHYSVVPNNAQYNDTVIWKSNSAVLSIDESGYFHCDGVGTAEVTAYLSDHPNIKKTITVEVTQ